MADRVRKIEDHIKSATDPDAALAQQSGSVAEPVGTPGNPSNQILTAANVITFARLLLTIAFLVLFVRGGNRWVALGCYATAAITDFLDGQVARRTQTVSWLGKVMDPIMDRVLLFTGVLGLLVTGELPLWVAVFVIARDCYLGLGGLYLQRFRRRPVDVVFIGKVTTALLMFGFCSLLLGLPVIGGLGLTDVAWLPGLNSQSSCVGVLFVYVGVICSAVTAIIYTRQGLAIRREALAGHASD